MEKALKMPRIERYKRMRRKRNIVREDNAYKWAAAIILELTKLV
jgi:trehalose-6-phosphate synthase